MVQCCWDCVGIGTNNKGTHSTTCQCKLKILPQNLLCTQMGTSSSTASWQQHWAAHLESVKNQFPVHGSLGYTQLGSSTCTRKEIKYCCSQFHGNSKVRWLPRCQCVVAGKASVWSWSSCFSLCINPCSSSAAQAQAIPQHVHNTAEPCPILEFPFVSQQSCWHKWVTDLL